MTSCQLFLHVFLQSCSSHIITKCCLSLLIRVQFPKKIPKSKDPKQTPIKNVWLLFFVPDFVSYYFGSFFWAQILFLIILAAICWAQQTYFHRGNDLQDRAGGHDVHGGGALHRGGGAKQAAGSWVTGSTVSLGPKKKTMRQLLHRKNVCIYVI